MGLLLRAYRPGDASGRLLSPGDPGEAAVDLRVVERDAQGVQGLDSRVHHGEVLDVVEGQHDEGAAGDPDVEGAVGGVREVIGVAAVSSGATSRTRRPLISFR